MCGIVLSCNVFIVFTVVLYFIMWLYCVFYCRTSLKTNFPQGAIKFAIELKQGHKNTRCISNSAGVCGVKLQQFFTRILNITPLLWFTLACDALDLLTKVLFSNLHIYLYFLSHINKHLKHFIKINFTLIFFSFFLNYNNKESSTRKCSCSCFDCVLHGGK